MKKTVRKYELELETPVKVTFEGLKAITINGFKLKVVATDEEEELALNPVAGQN